MKRRQTEIERRPTERQDRERKSRETMRDREKRKNREKRKGEILNKRNTTTHNKLSTAFPYYLGKIFPRLRLILVP